MTLHFCIIPLKMTGGLYKMSNIISVSISKEQSDFIDEMDISPSKLLQDSINVAMENTKISQKVLDEFKRKILALQDTLNMQRTFIERKGLMDDFINTPRDKL